MPANIKNLDFAKNLDFIIRSGFQIKYDVYRQTCLPAGRQASLLRKAMFAGKHIVMENYWVGKVGEDTVAKYLIGKKYKIVERNFRTKFGEIDIVAKDYMGTLIMIEVKLLVVNSSASLKPEDNLTAAKLKKFRRVSQYYASLHPEYINEALGFRLDVIALQCPTAESLNDPLRLCDMRHYENIA